MVAIITKIGMKGALGRRKRMLTDPINNRYINLALDFVRRMYHVYPGTTRVSQAGPHVT
jgi:hypothetical protein